MAFYGLILLGAWRWMLWMPGHSEEGPLPPLTPAEIELRGQLHRDVGVLAGRIGERNVPYNPRALEEAATFVETSLAGTGYNVRSLPYNAAGFVCRNVEAEIRGNERSQEIVIVGAHYDSVLDSPGADDNASGVSTLLALARKFAGAKTARTLRFVAFANEEPPYFGQPEMGSLVYARQCRMRGDHIVAMLSIESVGFFTDLPSSQRYPAGLGLLYPPIGNFVAFVGNVRSRPLVHEALRAFRDTAALPSQGAAVPNAIPGAGWSDHWSFWHEGFPGIEITDTALYRNPYYHTAADMPDRLDYDRIARFATGMREVVGKLGGLDTSAPR